MNPDGLVLLLNYREDGVTRKYNPKAMFFLTDRLCSLLHRLEGRPQEREAMIGSFAFFLFPSHYNWLCGKSKPHCIQLNRYYIEKHTALEIELCYIKLKFMPNISARFMHSSLEIQPKFRQTETQGAGYVWHANL